MNTLHHISVLGVASRWLEYLALVTVTGGGFFLNRVLHVSLQDCPLLLREKVLAAAQARFYVLAGISLGVLLLTSLLSLAEQTAVAAMVPLTHTGPFLLLVMTQTRWGKVWMGKIVLWGLFTAMLFRGRGQRKRRTTNVPPPGREAAVVGCLLLLTASLSGHASAKGLLSLAVVSDWSHFIAASAWIGGLLHLTVLLPWLLDHLEAEKGVLLSSLIDSFSVLTLIAVGILMMTGVYAAWLRVGSLAALLTTAYGNVLLVKLSLFVPLLLVGALNRYRLRPALSRLRQLPRQDIGQIEPLARRLFLLVSLETLLALGILLCTAVLTHLAPVH